jgi:prepilin-type N-terminal cleavage/methylation domain-containing protein
MIKENKQNNKKGFTLVETLVAIFILVLSITGPMSAASSSLQASFIARDQVVAFYLAQDVFEFIKNFRDREALSGEDWKDTLNSCISSTGMQCNIDSFNSAFLPNCGNGSLTSDPDSLKCPNLEVDGNGMYVANGDSQSKFKRVMFINDVTPDETEITVVIEWTTNTFLTPRRRIVVQENIYDWLPID